MTTSDAHEVFYTGATTDLAALLAVCPWPSNAFFLAERLPMQVITDPQERQDLLRFARVSELQAQGQDGINPALYTSGRIFCPEFELRWDQQQEPGQIRLVYSGSEEAWSTFPALQAACKSDVVFLTNPVRRAYYLFGESLTSERAKNMGLEESDDSWYYAEVRIPRLLRYPKLDNAKNRRRVKLAVYEYLDEAGTVNWFRFQKLDAED